MAQPQAYNREVDFTERDGDDTNHAGINAELDAAALSINQIRDNLELIQKDDGSLQNGIVGAEQLAPSAFDAVKGELNEAVSDAQSAAAQSTLAANTSIAARDAALAAQAAAETANTSSALNATTASTKAAEANASAAAAAASATASGNSATASQTSRLASEAARDAAQSAQAAAAASQTASATSEANASASAATATTQAGIATTQAGIATTQAASASASATAAAASLDSFDDRYLGPKSAAPTTDNDGNALLTGALYFDTTAAEMRVFTGSVWKAIGSAVNGTTNRASYTATAGQTTFGITYDVGFVDVYLNGLKLQATVDFTATNGTSIVLTTGATVGDVVDIVAYGVFTVANTYTKTEADALLAAKANQATTYTKTEVDTALAGKQPSLGYTPVNKAGDTMTGVLTSPGYRSDGSGALGGGFDGTTGSGNFGVRVRAKSDDSVAILQFTNNVASAQWGVLNSYPSGAIGMPYQPSFRARFASRSSVYGGGTALFDQPTHNTGNNYSTSTGRFTAPVSGVYQFHMNVQHYAGTATGSTHDILVNGAFAQARCEHVTGANFECHSASLIVYLNAGDYVECQSGSSVWWSDFAQFCGALIG